MSTSGNALLDSSTNKLLSSQTPQTDVSSPTGILPVVNGGTGSSTSSGARTSIGAAVSGANSDITSLSALSTPLSVAQGGTGDATLAAHGILIGNGTSAVVITSVGTTGTVLHGNTGADPTYSSVSLTADVSGTLSIANGGTAATTAENARVSLGTIGILSTTTGIDGKVATTTNLYTVPAGKTAVITAMNIRLTTATAISGTLNCGAGIASGESDIFAPVATTGFNTVTETWRFSASSNYVVATAGQIIKLGIRNGFGGTTATLAVDLQGYLV